MLGSCLSRLQNKVGGVHTQPHWMDTQASVLGGSELTGRFSPSPPARLRENTQFPSPPQGGTRPQDLEGVTHQLCHILAPEQGLLLRKSQLLQPSHGHVVEQKP